MLILSYAKQFSFTWKWVKFACEWKMKEWAPRLALKKRLEVIRKWPILDWHQFGAFWCSKIFYFVLNKENISFCRTGSWGKSGLVADGGTFESWPRSFRCVVGQDTLLWPLFTAGDLGEVPRGRVSFILGKKKKKSQKEGKPAGQAKQNWAPP